MASPGERKLLITGIAGFTGAHLAAAQRAAGWSVIGLHHPDVPHGNEHDLAADLLETDRIADWIAAERPSHIVHLAAASHVVGDALGFYRNNVLGTESLFDAIAKSGVVPRKVIVASSANVYGNAERSPIAEDAPLRPMNHYALSKVATELLAAKWFDRLPIVITRPFNYTGPGQSVSFVVPKIVAAFCARQPVLKLGNLDVARDLSDVRFVIEAYARLLTGDAASLIVNLCSGRSVSLARLLDLMEQVAGFRPRVEVDPALVRPDEVRELCGDPSRLFATVGDIPVIPLQDTLQTMARTIDRANP